MAGVENETRYLNSGIAVIDDRTEPPLQYPLSQFETIVTQLVLNAHKEDSANEEKLRWNIDHDNERRNIKNSMGGRDAQTLNKIEEALNSDLSEDVLVTDLTEQDMLITLEIPNPNKEKGLYLVPSTEERAGKKSIRRSIDEPHVRVTLVDQSKGTISDEGVLTYPQYEFILSPKKDIIMYREDLIEDHEHSPQSNHGGVSHLSRRTDDDAPTIHGRALQRYSQLMRILTEQLEGGQTETTNVTNVIQLSSRRKS